MDTKECLHDVTRQRDMLLALLVDAPITQATLLRLADNLPEDVVERCAPPLAERIRRFKNSELDLSSHVCFLLNFAAWMCCHPDLPVFSEEELAIALSAWARDRKFTYPRNARPWLARALYSAIRHYNYVAGTRAYTDVISRISLNTPHSVREVDFSETVRDYKTLVKLIEESKYAPL
jgi:hypothetical protein